MRRFAYSEETRARAVELAQKTNVRAASYFLNIPINTIYNWMPKTPTTPAVEVVAAPPTLLSGHDKDELVAALRDLKTSVDLLTEALLDSAR